ncbi:MAG TPA: glycosyltransferase [Candidatus Limnocylindrales bacterium]|nr:glycosyltransferase [Candidatus Limnocylindrales bacterium]
MGDAAREAAPGAGRSPVARDPVTLIVTVRNEEASIDALLDSLLAGSRAPDEIVVAEGGSADATPARLRARAAADPRVRWLSAPGNRSVGRNAAARAARSALIACTDAGVQVEPEWLERITAPFADPGVDVVAGFYRPVGTTWFERAAGVISAPRLSEVNLGRFLPSTRSIAFRRSAWEKVGGFDERWDHNEDTPFALALKKAGFRFAFAPDAVVRWHPRGDLRSFWRQHRRFGYGDGESRVQGWFYATIAAKYALALALFIAGFWFRPAWSALLAGTLLFALSQARRGRGRVGAGVALLAVPALKVAYDAAYLWGYARGTLGTGAGKR